MSQLPRRVQNDPRMPRSTMRKKKKSRAPVIIAIIAVLLIAIAAAVILFVVPKLNAPKNGEIVQVEEVEAVSIVGATEKPDDDVFAQEISGANEEALAELAGENLIEDGVVALQGVDEFEEMEMGADINDDTVVAEFKGGTLTLGEVAEEYNNQLALYLFAGYTQEEIPKELVQETMQEMIISRVAKEHESEMGIEPISDEEKAELEERARAEYEEDIEFYIDFVRDETMSDEEAREQTEAYLTEFEGITYESILKMMEDEIHAERVFDAITKDVTIDDASVRSAYDDLLAMQEASFNEDPQNYEMEIMQGGTIVYNLPGYRKVKMVSIYLDDETEAYAMELQQEIMELDATQDADRIMEINQELENCYAMCDERAAAVPAEVKNGMDFDKAVENYSEDAEFLPEMIRRDGYYISNNSTEFFEETVIEAAMALAKPGDISDVVKTETGACVMMYVGDVTEGPVPFESIDDQLRAQTLEEVKYSVYEAKCAEWLESAEPVYYPERMY